MQPRDRIIVALDVPTASEASRLVDQLSPHVGYFKIGLQLFSAEGPSIVHQVREQGGRIFLDLKLHDIPNTVSSAALEAARMGVDMLTLHTLGGETMMRHAAETVSKSAATSDSELLLLGVTVLTSMSQKSLDSIGFQRPLDELVLHLARQAWDSGLKGVVCSPKEVRLLRESGLTELTLVVPGIRPSGTSTDDQARTLTPVEAVTRGADYLVIGRPITRAPDPAQAARSIGEEIGGLD